MGGFMGRLDTISGGVLFFLGLVLAFDATKLTFWGPMGPREGFFPVILGVFLGGLGLLLVIRAVCRRPSSAEPQKVLGPKKAKLLIYVAAFLLFGVGLNYAGYTLTIVLFLVFIFRFVEKRTTIFTIATTVICVILSYFVFVKFLGIPLPEGLLTPVANFLQEVAMRG